MTNTRNTPVEALERAYLLRRLRRGSGGTGLTPGGEGIKQDVQVLEDCTRPSHHRTSDLRAMGRPAAKPGSIGENLLLPASDETRRNGCWISALSASTRATCCAC